MAEPASPQKMDLRKHETSTRIPLPPGTCFVMKTLPYPDGRWPPERNNNHPFIVLQSNKDGNCVLCAMAQTLVCEYEGKDHYGQFERHMDTCIEIKAPNPPMEPRETRMQYADLANLIWIPKKELFDDPSFRICQTGDRDNPTPLLDTPVTVGYDEAGEPVTRSQIQCIRTKAARLIKEGAVSIFDWYDYAGTPVPERQEYYGLDGCRTDPLYERLARKQAAGEKATQLRSAGRQERPGQEKRPDAEKPRKNKQKQPARDRKMPRQPSDRKDRGRSWDITDR